MSCLGDEWAGSPSCHGRGVGRSAASSDKQAFLGPGFRGGQMIGHQQRVPSFLTHPLPACPSFTQTLACRYTDRALFRYLGDFLLCIDLPVGLYIIIHFIP